jgi:hypothetical protein
VKIDFDGRMWDFDIEDVTVGQCEAVEKFTGAKGMGDWSNKLEAGNTKAVIALWWLMRKQAGEETGPISQPGDSFRPLRLLSAFVAAGLTEAAAAVAAAEAEAEAEAQGPPADPTRTAARARGSRARPPAATITAAPGGATFSGGAGSGPPG